MKPPNGIGRLQHLLAVARGDEPADLLLRNGRIVNVFTGEVREGSVAICDDRIAGVSREYHRTKETVELAGAYVAPGFIDGHVHIESSLLPVHEFVRLCLISGTTAVVADPHEIANVLGIAGVKYMLRASRGMPLDVFLMVPSCVPATGMETSGAVIGPKETENLLKLDRVIGLAEMMNYPGVVFGDTKVLAKLAAVRRQRRPVDGHAPGVGDKLLQAYVAAGIGSDHECVGPQEAMEKLAAGMMLMVREGSAARNLAALASVVNDFRLRRCCLVTDDKHPGELVREGHLNSVLRRAVSAGIPAVGAVQMVTLNPAGYFGLADRGAVAPGYLADVVVLHDLVGFVPMMVIKSGKVVVKDGRLTCRLRPMADGKVLDTVKVGRLTERSFAIRARSGLCNVIRVVPEQIITERHILPTPVENGFVKADTERDILKLAVIERHRGTGRIGLGLVNGFGLKKGALATTVAHDSHNVIAVGTHDRDMFAAVRVLVRMGGGYAAAADGRVVARLALPIAGLMSTRPAATVIRGQKALIEKAHVWGSRLPNPFATLSFLALPVIPELKLTDRGLIDVNRFRIIDLFDTG